jgi:hypothetical protein
MTSPVQSAAKALLDEIPAPKGAVNTLVGSDDHGPYIRVMVDPIYWFSVSKIPSDFRGFRVLSEKREPSLAFHH